MRCGWSIRSAGGPAPDLTTRTRSSPLPGTSRPKRSSRLVRPPLGAAGRRGGRRGRGAARSSATRAASRMRRQARRWSTKSAASFATSPGSSSARPAHAPWGLPGRRPTRSSFHRRAFALSLPSRCAAKIRLLAVTPEPQLAMKGCAGSMPASSNSRRSSSRGLKRAVLVDRARRTAGCARRGYGPRATPGRGSGSVPSKRALPRASTQRLAGAARGSAAW